MRCSLANRAGGGALDFRRPRCGQARFSVVATKHRTKQLVALKQQLVEVVGVAGDAEGGAERGCEVPDGLAASAGVAHKAPGWHQVNSK